MDLATLLLMLAFIGLVAALAYDAGWSRGFEARGSSNDVREIVE